MKNILFCLLVLLFATAMANANEGSRVSIQATENNALAGRVIYKFQLFDQETKKHLSIDDLKISHEKKLHMLAYDPALNQFQHVHPSYDGEFWVVEMSFTVNGRYWIWAQGVLASGSEEFSASTRLSISAGNPELPAPPELQDVRSNTDGISIATLDDQKLRADRHAMLLLTISRTDETQPQLNPYLGAFAHVIGVPGGGDELLHVHPANTSNPSQGQIHVTFPAAGFYRLWVQFLDAWELKTVPLSVQVF